MIELHERIVYFSMNSTFLKTCTVINNFPNLQIYYSDHFDRAIAICIQSSSPSLKHTCIKGFTNLNS